MRQQANGVRERGNSGGGPPERPSSFPWPPVIFVRALLAGLAVEWMSPLQAPSWLANAPVRALGFIAVMVGIVLDAAAILTMRRAETTILPTRPTFRLLTSGPFGITRNPIYLGNTIVLFGPGLLLAVEWLLPSLSGQSRPAVPASTAVVGERARG